jgi:hypothetical protein
MGTTPIWRMSISQQNKDVNDIVNEWTENGGREASDKACKAIREYYKQEQKRKQLIQTGGPGVSNPTEAFLKQAEYENNLANPFDYLPRPPEEYTEAHYKDLNDEHAIILYEYHKQHAEKLKGYFNIVYKFDASKRTNVPTVLNSEYERRRKEREEAEINAIKEQRRKREEEAEQRRIAEQEKLERMIAQERESDSNKPLAQLVREIVSQIRSGGTTTNEIVARKLGISVPEVNKLSHSTYDLDREVTEKLLAPGGYATYQQRDDYNRKKTEEAAERLRQEREYERTRAILKIKQDEERLKQEAELKRKQEEKERQEFEEEVNSFVRDLLNPKEDADGFLIWHETDYEVTAEEFARIRAIPSEDEKKTEARNYAEQKVKERRELVNQPDDIQYQVYSPREDKVLIKHITNHFLDPEHKIETFLSSLSIDFPDVKPEEVYRIKKMTDPELQKIEAKFYAEKLARARRKRIDKDRQKEQEAAQAAAVKTKSRTLKH